MGKVLLCHLQPPREWAQRAAYLLIGLWVVPVLAQRAAGFRAVLGWKYGWGGGRERSVEPGERLGSSRREALAIHKALTRGECVPAPGLCTLTPCEVCGLGVTLPSG